MDPQIPIYVLQSITEVINKSNMSLHSLQYWFLMGSSVIGKIRDWDSKDIDVYYYYYGKNPKNKKKHKNRIANKFYSDLAQTINIDIVDSLTIDKYYDGTISLTDYIFNEKRNELTVKMGRMNAITPEAYFLIRLPLKDNHNSLKLMYEKLFNKNIPKIIHNAVNRFELKKELDKFIYSLN